MTRKAFFSCLLGMILTGCASQKSVHDQLVEIHDRNRPNNIDNWPESERAKFKELNKLQLLQIGR